MYTVQLDESGYFTGSYAKVGSIPGGVKISQLPQRMDKPTCNKLVKEELTQTVSIPVYDLETDKQKVDENGELVFSLQEKNIGVFENRWLFDEDKASLLEASLLEERIRNEREKAFALIDKYQLPLLYAELTYEQKEELASYRKSWLEAPQTRITPESLDWMI